MQVVDGAGQTVLSGTQISTGGVDRLQSVVDGAHCSSVVGFDVGAGAGDGFAAQAAQGAASAAAHRGAQANGDLVVATGVGADLEGHDAGGAVEQVLAVELGAGSDTVDLFEHRLELFVQSLTVFGAVGVVSRLDCQFTHTLQNVGLLLHRTFSGLGDGDSVVGVFDRHGLAADLRGHAGSDLQAGGVVFGAVDFQAGRQTGHRGAQRVGSTVQVLLNAQRGGVGVNSQSHDEFLVGLGTTASGLGNSPGVAQRTFVIVIVVRADCFSGFSKKLLASCQPNEIKELTPRYRQLVDAEPPCSALRRRDRFAGFPAKETAAST
ncbi:hypothetical protein D3C76_261360 [compost metagenome]